MCLEPTLSCFFHHSLKMFLPIGRRRSEKDWKNYKKETEQYLETPLRKIKLEGKFWTLVNLESSSELRIHIETRKLGTIKLIEEVLKTNYFTITAIALLQLFCFFEKAKNKSLSESIY